MTTNSEQQESRKNHLVKEAKLQSAINKRSLRATKVLLSLFKVYDMIYDMIFLYLSHSGDISKITAAVHIRASMKINIKHKTQH